MVLLGVQPRQTNNLGGIKRKNKKQKTKNKIKICSSRSYFFYLNYLKGYHNTVFSIVNNK